MSVSDEIEKPCGEPEPATTPAHTMRKVADIQNRPFGFMHEGKTYDCNPTAADIQQAIGNKQLDQRSAQGHRDVLGAEWLRKCKGSLDEQARLQKAYNARRIAYLVLNGWDDPIRLEANGIMHDGTHRLRAAIHKGDAEIKTKTVV